MNIRVLTAFFVALSFFAADLQAQMARKIPMFEHYTQASCGPCATLNPIFEAVRENNVGAVNHVAYHTSWPGVDPMYSANPAPVDDMVSVYGVSGVPTLIMDGVDIGSPAAGTQGAIDAASAPGSPIRIVVSETTTGSTRDVTVSVQSAIAPPSGTFRMRTLVIEDDINYSSPPGSNGEIYFPNVFREMLSGTTSGDAVTLAASGMSSDYTFSYTLDASWDASNTYVIAYVYNSSTGEVLNSGSTLISPVEAVSTGTAFVEGAGTSDFTANVGNFGDDDESITISVLADHPADWTLEYEILGTSYTGDATVSLPASSSENLELRVTNGTTPGLGEYTVSVSWDANPDLAPQNLKYYVIHDVTDLVVTNEEGWGTALSFPIDEWESLYDGALNNAGRDTRAATSHFAFLKGMDDDALNGVYNIYYNVGWSFPSFTDEKVAAFESFLDRGGNLMIAGQDIAWEIMDAGSSYGTTANQNFFTNYIQGDYVSDGTPASTNVDFVSSDIWLGTAGSASINAVYGASFLYPDEVNPSGPDASSIFYYNGTESKSGGIRTETADYKLVYFGIGVEMFDDPAVQLAAVKLTHDYFWNGVSGLEFEQALSEAILGQNQPNPANSFTVIPLNELEDQAVLTIMDLQGKTIYSEVVNAFDNSVTINLEQFSTGIYTYFLQSGNSVTPARKLSVVK
jgi:thiol-disulfide isomerase/thioredoxin